MPREKHKIPDAERALRRVLKDSVQDLWLDTIRRATLPAHDSLIYWMLNQTECDFAVAMHAFYRSDPARHLDHPKPLPQRPTQSNLFALVLRNWDTGSYRMHRLLIEDADVTPRQIARLNQKIMAHPKGALTFTIPQRFLQIEGGVPLRLPPHLSPAEARHLWPIYAELKLDVPAAPPGFRRTLAKAGALLERLRIKGGKR